MNRSHRPSAVPEIAENPAEMLKISTTNMLEAPVVIWHIHTNAVDLDRRDFVRRV